MYLYRVAIVLDWEKPRIDIKGIYAGARVKRGHDWNNGDEDHTLVNHFVALFIYFYVIFSSRLPLSPISLIWIIIGWHPRRRSSD